MDTVLVFLDAEEALANPTEATLRVFYGNGKRDIHFGVH